MKRIALITGLLTVAIYKGSYSQTQPTFDKIRKAADMFEDYRAKLNLSDKQSHLVNDVDSVYFAHLALLRSSKDFGASKANEFEKLYTARDAWMKGVLKQGQFKVYLQFKSEMEKEFKSLRDN